VTAVALFEDPAVAPERAGEFCDALLSLLRRFGLEAVVYGHAAAGCLHVRPLVDPSSPGLAQRLLLALEEVSELVGSFGGAITGEHGWGIARSHLVPRALGPELYGRCVAVKRAWDPEGVLNPGRIVDAPPPDPGALSIGRPTF
jgi:FAD/FMN-containing dehydrogenase